MPVVVCLLRGINVGGRTSLPMAALRSTLAAAGYGDVATYIQSGNVVLSTPAQDTAALAADLEAVIAAEFPLAPRVTVRTAAELRAIHAGNPFIARGEAPEHQHVAFLLDRAAATIPDGLERFLPEEVAVLGSEVYLHLPGGMGRSKLADELTRRGGQDGTVRNWRTVTKLLELVDAR